MAKSKIKMKAVIAKYKDSDGMEHVVTAEEAAEINRVMNPHPKYNCKCCGVPVALAKRGKKYYFRAIGKRLEKRSEEEKKYNGHKSNCEFLAKVKRNTIQSKSFSRDVSNLNIEELLRRSEEMKQDENSGIKPVAPVNTTTKPEEKKNDEEEVSSLKPREIRTRKDLYEASLTRGLGNKKIWLSTGSDKKDTIESCVLNSHTFSSFRDGTFELIGYKLAVAMKISAEVANAIRDRLKEKGMPYSWVLCDPYAGDALKRVFFVFSEENRKAWNSFTDTLRSSQGPGSLYLIGCEWERIADEGSDMLAIDLKGQEGKVRCYRGHIRGENIEKLPALNTSECLEDPDFVDFDFTKTDPQS